MSDELMLFEGMKAKDLPKHMQNVGADEATRALVGGAGGGKRISIKGSVFRMIVNGDEIQVNEDRAMNMVIVRVAPHVHRTYYPNAFEEGAFSPPVCWSEDGRAPHKASTTPQSNSCATCSQNVAGSSNNGKGRACSFSRRIAVLLEGDLKGDLFSLSLPSTSIFGKAEGTKMPLEAYAKYINGHKTRITAVVTEVRFDTSTPHPKLFFSPVRPLTDDEWDITNACGESIEATDLVNIPSYASWSNNGDDPETHKAVVAPRVVKKPSGPKVKPENDIADVLSEWDD
jgi:hypothetical protein